MMIFFYYFYEKQCSWKHVLDTGDRESMHVSLG